MNKEKPYIEITLSGDERYEVTPDDVGLFLYDLGSLYELVRLALDPKYEGFKFSRFALYRGGRHLHKEDRMYVDRIRQESPIEVQTVIAITGSITAISAFITMITVLYNQPLNREKLRAELEAARLNIENAEIEKKKKQLEIKKLEREELQAIKKESKIISLSGVETELVLREAIEPIETVERRLEKSPIQIKQIDFKVEDPIGDAKLRKGLHDWLTIKDEEE